MEEQLSSDQGFDSEWLTRHIRSVLDIHVPPAFSYDLLSPIIDVLFTPTFVGTANIPDKPCLYVANHSLFALDAVVLVPSLYERLNIFLRPLADSSLWAGFNDDLVTRLGAALANRQVCEALMKEQRDILVFPGGFREAVKPKKDRYKLLWNDRTGFVKVAAAAGYTIMPVAIVGPDEFYDHWGNKNARHTQIYKQFLRKTGLLGNQFDDETVPPLPVGALGTLLPKIHRCYFKFGSPINLEGKKGKRITEKTATKIRDEVAQSINSMIASLRKMKARDSESDGILRKILSR
ncbi:MAG: lysophospholipid acyltransferase family protein [bacterium]